VAPPTDAVAALQPDHRKAALHECPRGCQAGEPGSNDDDAVHSSALSPSYVDLCVALLKITKVSRALLCAV
jgi:hypothetical protein